MLDFHVILFEAVLDLFYVYFRIFAAIYRVFTNLASHLAHSLKRGYNNRHDFSPRDRGGILFCQTRMFIAAFSKDHT